MGFGLDKFIEYFTGYDEQYAVIGGQACEVLLEKANIGFRTTRDIDMILIVEAYTTAFGEKLKCFIEDGGYEPRVRKDGRIEFYRFVNPQKSDFPYMIELFARPENGVLMNDFDKYIQISTDDEMLSLSAILLNQNYYDFIKSGRTTVRNISILDVLHIIPLKMKAWLDLNEERRKGEKVNSKDIKKHRRDVFTLFQLVDEDSSIEVSKEIFNDIQSFISEMRKDSKSLEEIGVEGIKRSKNEVLDIFEKMYVLNERI